jgi:hypothetical protein
MTYPSPVHDWREFDYDPGIAMHIGLGGEKTFSRGLIPKGYHRSGRYMPLQGGSNTRRRILALPEYKDRQPTGVIWKYLEDLEDLFDRISR